MNEKQKLNYKIVGFNLLAVVIYSLICRVADSADGWGALMVLIGVHVFVCLIWSFVSLFIREYKRQSGLWLLSALLVLIIGFSTCVTAFTIRI